MSYLLIENQGEIDVNALILMGGTTKREEKNKIGYFGSGNKYAIANMITKGIEFKIFSGDKEIQITTRDIEFRDKKFKQIYIDGKETSLTTDMGPLWEEWFSIREWVSNSIDEGGHNIINYIDHINSRSGYTRIYIKITDSIKFIIDNWDRYFTFDRDDYAYSNVAGKIFPNTDSENSLILFRRGIRCFYAKGNKSLYHYDLVDFKINESRTIEDTWSANYVITQYLNSIKDVSILKNILDKAASKDTYENRLNYYYGLNKLSQYWREAIGNNKIIVDDYAGHFIEEQKAYDCYIVCIDLAKQIKKSFPDVEVLGLLDDMSEGGIKEIETTPKQEFLLKECIRFLEETKYDISYPIKIVSFVGANNRLGLAKNNTIYLSENLFTMGKREIVVTIMEENEHLKTKFKDCSRQFQNHWINLFISEKEERFCNYL